MTLPPTNPAASSPNPSGTQRTLRPRAPAQAEEREWRHWFREPAGEPRFPFARRFLRRDLAQALQRAVPKDARVLEVGSGTGDLLASLPNRSRTGIDYSPSAVAEARTRYPELEVAEGDALSFHRDERYEAIVADRLIHSVPDVQLLLENLSAHLAEHGRIFLTCYNYLWESPLRLGERAGLRLATPPSNWLGETDLQNLFTIAGLEVVKYEDRLLMPASVPVLAGLLNRYVAKLPLLNNLSLYRLYVLRKRATSVRATAPKVTVVVPARNEAGNIPNIIERTPVMGAGTELIFVEGGSTDDTADAIDRAIASYEGPLTLKRFTQTGKGKGDAVRLGFGQATGDLLMILDADLTVPPEDLPKFYDVMTSGMADYVHGTRLVYPMEKDAMRFLNKLGNVAFSTLFSYLLNQPIKDTLCGTKVLWAADYARLAANRSFFGDFDPFGDFDLIFGSTKLNLKLLEIPVRYRDRTYGTTNISRFRHGWLLLRMSALAARKLKFV
jgi:SAM-dependent methyltransferase